MVQESSPQLLDTMQTLSEVVATLRSERGCAWDRQQTHASLRNALLDEAYEASEAIEQADDAALREELGDLLLVVALHARIAQERGAFDLAEAAGSAVEKLLRRHPQVFGPTPGAPAVSWSESKRREGRGVLTGVPRSQPALSRARLLSERAARVGFDWVDAPSVLDKVREELGELEQASTGASREALTEELGDLLFALVNFARKSGIDAEQALHQCSDKFTNRFGYIEAELARRGRAPQSATMDELEALWTQAKAASRR